MLIFSKTLHLSLLLFLLRCAVGPVSLVGGTAAIYSSLLHHPSSTLNQLSFVLMMLLAIQYAIQPRLSKKYIHPSIQKESVALVEEVVKTGFATAIFFSKPASEVSSALKGTCNSFAFGMLCAWRSVTKANEATGIFDAI